MVQQVKVKVILLFCSGLLLQPDSETDLESKKLNQISNILYSDNLIKNYLAATARYDMKIETMINEQWQ